LQTELFVYGTLKREEVLRKLRIPPMFTSEGWVEGRLYRAGWFPILLPSRGGRVWGRVLLCASHSLCLIDEYEGEGDELPLFLRTKLVVHTEEGERMCWGYVGNVAHPFVARVCTPENEIADGVW